MVGAYIIFMKKHEGLQPYDFGKESERAGEQLGIEMNTLKEGDTISVVTEAGTYTFEVVNPQGKKVLVKNGGDDLKDFEEKPVFLTGSKLVSGGRAIRDGWIMEGHPIELHLGDFQDCELPLTQEVWINGSKVLPVSDKGGIN